LGSFHVACIAALLDIPDVIVAQRRAFETGCRVGPFNYLGSCGKAVRYDRRRYKRRNRIEIMFGRLKDWCRVATRYARCVKTFLSAVALTATVMFWL